MGSKKILLIDDDITILEVNKLILELENYILLTARDGIEALKIIKDNKPDLIVSDLMMPNMDGFELLEELRANEDTKDISCLVLSSLNNEEAKKKVYDLGICDYLIKGIDPECLVKKINTALSMNSTSQDNITEIQILRVCILITFKSLLKVTT